MNKIFVKNDSSLNALIFPLLFGLATLLLRLFELDAKSLRLDESYTAFHSTFSFQELWTQPVVNKPPLYYVITSLFWSPGDGSFSLRLPAAILSSISVMLSWYLGMALAGRQAAFLLALFLLLSDINLAYGQEARQYILLSVGWLMVLLSMVRMLNSSASTSRPSGMDLLLLFFGTLVMVHTHPVAIHYIAASCIGYVVALLSGRKHAIAYLYLPLVIALIAGVTIIPWLLMTLTESSTFTWLKQAGIRKALTDYSRVFGARHLGGLFRIILVIVAIIGIRYWLLRRDRQVGMFLAIVLILPAVLLWVTGLVKPVYMFKTLVPLHLVAMVGLTLAVLSAEKWRVRYAAVVSLILALSSISYYIKFKKEPWVYITNQIMEKETAPGLLVCKSKLRHPLEFYLHDKMPVLFYLNRLDNTTSIWNSSTNQWVPLVSQVTLQLPDSIYVIDRGDKCEGMIGHELIVGAAEYALIDSWEGKHVTMKSYQKQENVRRPVD